MSPSPSLTPRPRRAAAAVWRIPSSLPVALVGLGLRGASVLTMTTGSISPGSAEDGEGQGIKLSAGACDVSGDTWASR